MEYLIYDNAYFDDFFEMALDLWKDFPKNDLRRVLLEIGESEKKQVFFAKDADSLIGFVYISIRQDYVEGADVFTNGIFGRHLCKTGLQKKRHCTRTFYFRRKLGLTKRMPSNRFLYLGLEQIIDSFSQKNWFQREDTLVHFIKNIDSKK